MNARKVTASAVKAGLITRPPTEALVKNGIELNDEKDTSLQPPLLLKAYAIALRDRFGGETDLSRPNQAIFVATPQQKGIPASVAIEYANEQLFQHVNAMQDDESIAYQQTRKGYFDYLDQYLAHVRSDEDSSADWQAYMDARNETELEADKLSQAYLDLLQDGQAPKWLEYINSDKGKRYLKAWDLRDEAARKLHLDNPGLLLALQSMDSSKAKAVPRQGQNMRSTLLDVLSTSEDRKIVDPKDRFYRPAHVLNGYYLDAEKWRDSYMNDIRKPASIDLDLRQAYSTAWKTLGFPKFDSMVSPLAKTDLDALDGWKITLTYTAVKPFSVGRGSWDIQAFCLLYGLGPEAKDYLREKIYKTVVLLLAYGVQIKLKRPADLLPHVLSKINLPGILGGLSLEEVSDTEFQTSAPNNDAYPVLLAVLAQKC